MLRRRHRPHPRQPSGRGLLIPTPAPACAAPAGAWSESQHLPVLRPPAAVPSPPPTPVAGTTPGPAGSFPCRWHRPGIPQRVLDPTRCAAVLPLHPNRLVPLLEKPGLVHHQDCLSVSQVLHYVALQVITDQAGVPLVGGQQALHPIGSGVARLLCQLPAVLALHRT